MHADQSNIVFYTPAIGVLLVTWCAYLINSKSRQSNWWVLGEISQHLLGAYTMLCYNMLSAAAVDGNVLYYTLGPAKSAMQWVYCYLPMMWNCYNRFTAFLALN